MRVYQLSIIFFFFNDTATTEIYTLSLHDALPISTTICGRSAHSRRRRGRCRTRCWWRRTRRPPARSSGRQSVSRRSSARSEEHTSELQSRQYLVCRLLLEKKKTKIQYRESNYT